MGQEHSREFVETQNLARVAGLVAGFVSLAWSADVEACTTRKFCAKYLTSLTDGEVGDFVGVDDQGNWDPYVPARGLHVIIMRPYPEPPLSGYLSVEDTQDLEAGCIEFESQFSAGHKAVLEAEAVLAQGEGAGIVVRAFGTPFNSSDPAGALGQLASWVVDMPPAPDGYSWETIIYPSDGVFPTTIGEVAALTNLLAVSTEVVHRLHNLSGTSPLTDVHPLNVFIDAGGQNAFASNGGDAIAVGTTGGVDKKFVIGHEIGHWVQQFVSEDENFGSFNLNYGPDCSGDLYDPFTPDNSVCGELSSVGNPWNDACKFAVVGWEDQGFETGATNPNRHGIRSAEFSSSAMVEGFGHFVAAAAFNDLETTGRYAYYKDIDQDELPDYASFELGEFARQVELAGGSAATTIGGASRWTSLQCGTDVGPNDENDWDHPLDSSPSGAEVSTEIDWLRLFWQFATAPYNGSDPATAPGFWDTVNLVIAAQDAPLSWTGQGVVWSRMDAAIDADLGGNDWVTRWRDLSDDVSGGNGVYNGDVYP